MAIINYRGYSMELNLSEGVSRILNLESAITLNKNKFDRLSQILQSNRATKKIVFLKNGLPIPQELYEIWEWHTHKEHKYETDVSERMNEGMVI